MTRSFVLSPYLAKNKKKYLAKNKKGIIMQEILVVICSTIGILNFTMNVVNV